MVLNYQDTPFLISEMGIVVGGAGIYLPCIDCPQYPDIHPSPKGAREIKGDTLMVAIYY